MGNNLEYIPIGTSNILGSLIRKRRKEAKITLNDMAGLIGVSPRFLGELERGRETVSASRLFQVLAALGIDLFARPRS